MKLKTIILSLLVFAFVATAHAQQKPIKSRHQTTHKVENSKKSAKIARKQAFFKKRRAKRAIERKERIRNEKKVMRVKKRHAMKSRKKGAKKASFSRKSPALTH